MSLTVYNNNLDVILHSPSQNKLIVYNKKSNEVELLNYDSNENDNYIDFDERCPNCGFNLGHTYAENGRRANATHSRDSDRFNGSTYTHNDYFRLLVSQDLQDSANNTQLPNSIFTQGYFEKFFRKLAKLGSGSSGAVYKVEHHLQDFPLGVYAIKKVPIGNDINFLSKALIEVKILYELSHPNLIRYNHVWVEMDKLDSKFKFNEDENIRIPYVYILQQYCSGGNLEDLVLSFKENGIKKEKLLRRERKKQVKSDTDFKLKFTNPEIVSLFEDIVSGVDHLHLNHIIHRDLKPSNCLLSEPYDKYKVPKVLVSDFGEGQFEGMIRTGLGNTGTLEYTAPELLFPDKNGVFKNFGYSSDVYSLGLILVWLCFGELPYSSADLGKLKEEILNYDDKLLSKWLDSMITKSEERAVFKQLILGMCEFDEKKRISTGEVLHGLSALTHVRKGGVVDEKKAKIVKLDDIQITDETIYNGLHNETPDNDNDIHHDGMLYNDNGILHDAMLYNDMKYNDKKYNDMLYNETITEKNEEINDSTSTLLLEVSPNQLQETQNTLIKYIIVTIEVSLALLTNSRILQLFIVFIIGLNLNRDETFNLRCGGLVIIATLFSYWSTQN